jgi:membrane-associated progesterone receptor component
MSKTTFTQTGNFDYTNAPTDIQLDPSFTIDHDSRIDMTEAFYMTIAWIQGNPIGNDIVLFYKDVIATANKGDLKSLFYVLLTCVIAFYIAYAVLGAAISPFFADQDPNYGKEAGSNGKKEAEEEREPPKDFTVAQLRDFDGTKGKPIYVSLSLEVYDVSSGRDFYGEGSGYHCFAGREASRAMAKLSFDEEDLANHDISDLGPFEKSVLDDWIQKFKHFKCYPIVGKVSIPPKDLELSREQMIEYRGLQEVPEGRIDAPIYIGINGKILDVSYGGKEMYGQGGPYFLFAGHDASKALAKMSFEEEHLRSTDLSDLTPEQQKTLSDWDKKLTVSRKYPVVGRIID